MAKTGCKIHSVGALGLVCISQRVQRQPRAQKKADIEARFDKIFTKETCFASLNNVLKRIHRNKPELLRVLDFPDLPLHNNLSENDIREYVKRRKISGSTRSKLGRQAGILS
jgi:hypothetical protein